MSTTLIAQLLVSLACLIAVGFHRCRAAQLFGVLMLMLIGINSQSPLLEQSALRFGPWLILAASFFPEARLLSKRSAVFLGALVFFTIASFGDADAALYKSLATLARWSVASVDAGTGAAMLVGAASMLCLLRWSLTKRTMELGLAATLLLFAAGFSDPSGPRASVLMAIAGFCGVIAVLFASYRMAFIDPLTGLPNRRALDEALTQLSGSYALAMVDVDHFKEFNDTYGHEVGDAVLRKVAQAVRRSTGGRAYRYGGEEFCVVYSGNGVKKASEKCEHMRQAVQDQRINIVEQLLSKRRVFPTRYMKPNALSVTISVGCAQKADNRKAASDVLKAADLALYRAKAKGRNRVVAV